MEGEDKGKRGEVVQLIRPLNAVVVDGVRMRREQLPPDQTKAEMFHEIPRPVSYHHVALVDPIDHLPTEVRRGYIDGEVMRFSVRTDAVMTLSTKFQHEHIKPDTSAAPVGRKDTALEVVNEATYSPSPVSFPETIYRALGTGRSLLQGDGGYFFGRYTPCDLSYIPL